LDVRKQTLPENLETFKALKAIDETPSRCFIAVFYSKIYKCCASFVLLSIVKFFSLECLQQKQFEKQIWL